MGKKYIIELEDKPFCKGGDFLYRVKGFKSLVFDMTGINKLIPYTEDAAYAHGYTEAESKYREIRDELEKQAYQRGYEEAYDTAYADAEGIYESGKRAMYQKGLKDAWECMKKIFLPVAEGGLPASALIQIFGNKPAEYFLKEYSASECIEKIRQYEQEKEELGIQGYFKKGEEVIDADGTKAVILRVSEDNYCQVYTEKGCIENWHIHTYKFHKTGRYFPEVAEVLQKMKENNDNK